MNFCLKDAEFYELSENIYFSYLNVTPSEVSDENQNAKKIISPTPKTKMHINGSLPKVHSSEIIFRLPCKPLTVLL